MLKTETLELSILRDLNVRSVVMYGHEKLGAAWKSAGSSREIGLQPTRNGLEAELLVSELARNRFEL